MICHLCGWQNVAHRDGVHTQGTIPWTRRIMSLLSFTTAGFYYDFMCVYRNSTACWRALIRSSYLKWLSVQYNRKILIRQLCFNQYWMKPFLILTVNVMKDWRCIARFFFFLLYISNPKSFSEIMNLWIKPFCLSWLWNVAIIKCSIMDLKTASVLFRKFVVFVFSQWHMGTKNCLVLLSKTGTWHLPSCPIGWKREIPNSFYTVGVFM